METNYQKQGADFLAKTGTTFKAEKIGHFLYFEGDKDSRDVYQITLARGTKIYSFRFGQSLDKSQPQVDKKNREWREYNNRMAGSPYTYKAESPTAYDVLASVTKSDPGTFSDFCSDFGYDTDSRKAEKDYFAVQEEWKNINRLFNDVLDDLQEVS